MGFRVYIVNKWQPFFADVRKNKETKVIVYALQIWMYFGYL